MNKNQNLITMKIKYKCNDSILQIIKQYNSVLRYTYNRLFENPKLTTPEITELQKSLNNVELIGSHLKNSAIYDAKSLIKKDNEEEIKPIVFGGKYLFKQRCQHKINKEEFYLKRLRPLNSVGKACKGANRLFKIIDTSTIQFNFNRHIKYTLNLYSIGKNRNKYLKKLIALQNSKAIAITYKLDLEYVYLTFDYNIFKNYKYTIKQNRVFAIDMNPNSIGWSIVDWTSDFNYKLIQSGTISLKPLNDYRDSIKASSDSDFAKYINNKRRTENIEIAKQLFKLCKYYHCEVFAIEKLKIKSSNKKKGKKFNKKVNNQWNRRLLVQQIKKHINSSSTILIECLPQYNSYIGNLLFRQEHLPDECLASIEIGRRGFEFSTQYTFNRRPRQKTVIYPKLELIKSQLILSLEELGIDVSNLDSWKDILSMVKESKVKYRFSTSDAQKFHLEGLFSKFYKQKYQIVYNYL